MKRSRRITDQKHKNNNEGRRQQLGNKNKVSQKNNNKEYDQNDKSE
jgi:hypothetical protein